MKNRFYINPLLYGAILGGISAFIGSMFFVAIGLVIFEGFQLDFAGFSLGLRLIFMFTALPGMAGGVFLGYLFSRYKFSRIKGVLYSMAAGAAAIAITVFFALIGGPVFDTLALELAVLAISIAAITAGAASFVLMKTNLTLDAS
jgi:hypothetical protein